MSITIIGLGPGDPRHLTREAWEVLEGAEELWLRTAHRKVMRAFYDKHREPWDQPQGLGDMLREMVLLYVVMSRPDGHLEDHLGDLGDRFGIDFTKLDAICALARAGKTWMARRLLPEVVKSRPSKPKHFAAFTRVAMCLFHNPNKNY